MSWSIQAIKYHPKEDLGLELLLPSAILKNPGLNILKRIKTFPV